MKTKALSLLLLGSWIRKGYPESQHKAAHSLVPGVSDRDNLTFGLSGTDKAVDA